MDSRLANKDNISLKSVGGRSLHTYTPRSHEDLLKSHLQLDNARKARLQNEVQRLAGDNERLRRELELTSQELRDKDARLELLNSELQTQRRLSLASSRGDDKMMFEVNGKQVTLEDLHRHFNIVIQRHHELLNRKNQEIQHLRDQLINQPKERNVIRKDIDTQSSRPNNEALQQNLMNDFSHQLALVRKEYEQVEFILQDRNNKLESLIGNLQCKLDEYAKEIHNLRKELAEREGNQKPTKSVMDLIQEKEKENNHLKEIIATLQSQPNNVIAQGSPQTTNDTLKLEIKNIIDGKKNTINKLNNVINVMRNDKAEIPDSSTGIEKDADKIISEIDDINNKLNKILIKLKDSPSSLGQSPEKNNLISDLEAVKKQCQEEIDILKNQISEPDAIILRGQAVVTIDDPNFLKNKPDGTNPLILKETPSNIKFVLYKESPYDVNMSTYKTNDKIPSEIVARADAFGETPRTFYTEPSVSSDYRHYPLIPCEACSEVQMLDKSVSFPSSPRPPIPSPPPREPPIAPPRALPRTLLSAPPSLPPSGPPPDEKGPSSTLHTPKEPGRHLIHEFRAPSIRSKSKDGKKKKGKGCCAKQSSDTSNAPYSKQVAEERVLNTYSAYPTNESSNKLYPTLKKDDFSYEFPTHTSSLRGRSPERKDFKAYSKR